MRVWGTGWGFFQIIPLTKPGDKPICFYSTPWTTISGLFSFMPLLSIYPLFCFLSSSPRYAELDQVTGAFFRVINVREVPWHQTLFSHLLRVRDCTRLEERILPLSRNKIHMLQKGDWQITANSDQKNLDLLSWSATATANAKDPHAETRRLQNGNNNRQDWLFCTLVLLLTLHSTSFCASWNRQYSSYATINQNSWHAFASKYKQGFWI